MELIPGLRSIRPLMPDQGPVKVLFVCLGNICRSPAAQGVMQAAVDRNNLEHNYIIDSAGTGSYHVGYLPDPRMRAAGRHRGYTFNHICRQVRPTDFQNFHIIVPMDHSNMRNLQRMAPTDTDAQKIVPMATFISPKFGFDHVPDPYYEGAEGFELVLNLLEDACANLIHAIQSARQPKDGKLPAPF